MYFGNQRFLVAGMSRSGCAACGFLLERGASVCMFDDVDSAAVRRAMEELSEKGARALRREELSAAAESCDVLVLSPGIPIDHELPVAFRRRGKRIIGEAELGCRYLRSPMVAVTGTNGKTTTVTMLCEIFRTAGKDCFACGNIGVPVTACVERGYGEIAVAEISSFQLETLSGILPHIAVVTNIAEDHLDRHYSMENYIFLKSKLLRNMRESEFAVLNSDDPAVRDMAKDARCPVRWFSARERTDGAFFSDGALYFENEKVMDAADLSLKGMHNVYNALAAVCAAGLMGVPAAAMAQALSSMRGVRHRIEKVAERGGVSFVDDSKGTNAGATMTAIDSMDADTVLLLGGKDTGEDYGPLFEKIRGSRVVHCVLYGENRFKLLNAAVHGNESRITLCVDFEIAVRVAAMTAKAGQCVLLSPASSSLDAFAGYEERGDRFVQIVKSLGEAADDAFGNVG